MNKKILKSALALSLGLGLFGCGNNNQGNSDVVELTYWYSW